MARELRYIKPERFLDEIPKEIQGILTDDSYETSDPNKNILLQKALAAEAEFESYVAKRYCLPVRASDGTVPDEVVQVIYDILKYKLYARRNALDSSIISQYEKAVGWLMNVAKGKLDIPFINEQNEVEEVPTVKVVTGKGSESAFSRFL